MKIIASQLRMPHVVTVLASNMRGEIEQLYVHISPPAFLSPNGAELADMSIRDADWELHTSTQNATLYIGRLREAMTITDDVAAEFRVRAGWLADHLDAVNSAAFERIN